MTDEKIKDVYIATEQVEEVMLGLNPNKASGPDRVESPFLKECAVELAPILQEIYQKSLDVASVPPQWKGPTLSQYTRVVPRQLWVTSDMLP